MAQFGPYITPQREKRTWPKGVGGDGVAACTKSERDVIVEIVDRRARAGRGSRGGRRRLVAEAAAGITLVVAALDLRHPAVKLPGFGRIGIDDGTAIAAPAM